MKNWIWVLVVVATLCNAWNHAVLEQQVLSLKTDNATQANRIRALEKDFEFMHGDHYSIKQNVRVLLGRDYKEYQLNTRQVAALKKRDRELHPQGNNLPY